MNTPKPVNVNNLTASLLVQACRALVAAYRRGKQNGGSVDWNDVDAAYKLAKNALKQLPKGITE